MVRWFENDVDRLSRDPASPRRARITMFSQTNSCSAQSYLFKLDKAKTDVSASLKIPLLDTRAQAFLISTTCPPLAAATKTYIASMNRGAYRPPTTSRASASTLCQKCLKRDEYDLSSHAALVLIFYHATSVMSAKQPPKTDRTSHAHRERSSFSIQSWRLS